MEKPKSYVHAHYLSAYYLIEKSEFDDKEHYNKYYKKLGECVALPVEFGVANCTKQDTLTIGDINSDIHGKNVRILEILPL